jgi:hypothetical protein
MKKLVLTKLAENELMNLNKIQNVLANSDIDLYYDFSSYDQLLFDMQMFVEEAYVENIFERIEDFAIEISLSEGSEYNNVLERINKALELNLVEIK